RAVKGDFGLIRAATALREELLGPAPVTVRETGLLTDEMSSLASMKKAAVMVFGLAMQTYGQTLAEEQEVLMHVANMLMDVYGAESALLRAQSAAADRPTAAALHAD